MDKRPFAHGRRKDGRREAAEPRAADRPDAPQPAKPRQPATARPTKAPPPPRRFDKRPFVHAGCGIVVFVVLLLLFWIPLSGSLEAQVRTRKVREREELKRHLADFVGSEMPETRRAALSAKGDDYFLILPADVERTGRRVLMLVPAHQAPLETAPGWTPWPVDALYDPTNGSTSEGYTYIDVP